MQHLSGNQFGLPLVSDLAVVRSHSSQRITWHAHDGWQLLFLLSGATAYEFKPGSDARIEIPGGHFCVVPPGVPHRGVQDARPPCALCFLVLDGRARRALKHTPFAAEDWRRLEQRLNRGRLEVRPFKGELQRSVSALVREAENFARRRQGTLAAARLRLLACEVLIEAAEQLDVPAPPSGDRVVSAVEHHLRQHFGEELRMEEVARQLGLSRARLFELFKRGTGMTPNDYLLRVRVHKARELLASTAKSVTTIAFDAGFGSSQYFSTVFRRYTGQTPLAYRKAHK
ncbi:MAG: helix-turn-helix transcriptional regulator [Verrucomicrobia bacterium]|nr:helix-turn-helix transcriptional regulator [Verrucomicrobiota bacterium]